MAKRAPALQVFWCTDCKKAVLWSLMADAESPQTVFEMLYTRFPTTPHLRLM
jgi:hypothetical protein